MGWSATAARFAYGGGSWSSHPLPNAAGSSLGGITQPSPIMSRVTTWTAALVIVPALLDMAHAAGTRAAEQPLEAAGQRHLVLAARVRVHG